MPKERTMIDQSERDRRRLAKFGTVWSDTDIQPVKLAEPPVIALRNDNDLTIWRHDDDGSVTIRLGYPDQIGADTINIPSHMLTAVWTTIRAAEGYLP